MKFVLAAAGVLALGLATPAMAANADHPFQNCDKRNDNCGPTGNDQTDQLNARQLNMPATTPMPGAPMPGAPMPGAPMPGAPMPPR